MPEQVQESAATETVEVVPDTGADLAAEVEKWKSLARKHETRAKENASAASRLAEIEEASKSEAQKLAERAEKLAERAERAERDLARFEVAAERSVPANLLTGSTVEELNASADALLAFKGKTPAAAPATGQGDVGKPVAPEKRDLDAEIRAAQTAGNTRLALSLTNQKLIEANTP